MAEAEKTSDPRTVQLKNVRLSFTDSLKDKKATVEDGVPKHSVNLILETDKPEFEANKEKVRAAMTAASEEFFKNPKMWSLIMDDDPKRVCYRKGERFKNKSTQEVYKGYAGNWGISCGTPAKGQRRPKMWDRRKKPVPEADILEVCYGGAYADVVVSFYGTDKGGNGVFCTVEAIRSREVGEHMGGGWAGDESVFDELEDDDSFDNDGAADNDPLG